MPKRNLEIVIALSAAFFATATPLAGAEIFKWINDDGTTTYSNQPPLDQSAVQEFTIVETPREAPVQAPQVGTEPPRIVVEPAKTQSDAPPARASVRSLMPQAVQDPCLTSSDRLCHQKNSGRYKPYVGYMPYGSTVADSQAIVPPARGATNGAAAGGAVGGASKH